MRRGERPGDGSGGNDAALRQEHPAFARDCHKVGEGSGRVGHVVTGDGARPLFTVDEDDQAFDQGGDLGQLDGVAQHHGLASAVIGSKAGPPDSPAVDETGQDELDGDASDDSERAPISRTSPTDVMATAKAIVDPEFNGLVSTARLWMETSGSLESELAARVELPIKYVARLLRGEPFPCSRAVADRIRARLQPSYAPTSIVS